MHHCCIQMELWAVIFKTNGHYCAPWLKCSSFECLKHCIVCCRPFWEYKDGSCFNLACLNIFLGVWNYIYNCLFSFRCSTTRSKNTFFSFAQGTNDRHLLKKGTGNSYQIALDKLAKNSPIKAASMVTDVSWNTIFRPNIFLSIVFT